MGQYTPIEYIPTLPYGCCKFYPISNYMLEQLNNHVNVNSIIVKNESSDTIDYHKYGYIQQPSRIDYELNGKLHTIKFDCRIGEIIDRWATPLFLYNVYYRTCTEYLKSVLLFVYDDNDKCRQGKVYCPHIVIDYDGEFVRSSGLSQTQQDQLMKLVNSNSDTEICFFQRFLEKCSLEVRIRHILSYIPSLHIKSGK
jgi:hypothetical protein